MKHNTRLSWTVGLAIAAPVMALTGCPGLFGPAPSTSPTVAPTTAATTAPTASPTPVTAAKVVLTKVAIDSAGTARSFTLKNVGGTAADLTKWAISYENKAGTNDALAMVHARIVGANDATLSLGANSTLEFTENVGCTSGNCVKLDSGLGSSAGVTKLGVQATHGSVVLYKGVTAAADLTGTNMTDYLQYGNLTQGTNSSNYTHAAAAVTAGLWESATATASAPGALGTSISVTTAGATGSTNWKKD